MKHISHKGRAQLSVDLDYLSNVIQAMGLTPHPIITHVRTLLNEHPSIMMKKLKEHTARGTAAVALHALQLCVVQACLPVTKL